MWIVFNGEIYNYEELRDYLLGRGHIFRTRTDMESIIHLYEEFELKGYVHGVLLDRTTTQRRYFKKPCIEGLLKANCESGLYSKEVLSLLTLELWHRAFSAQPLGVITPAPKSR